VLFIWVWEASLDERWIRKELSQPPCHRQCLTKAAVTTHESKVGIAPVGKRCTHVRANSFRDCPHLTHLTPLLAGTGVVQTTAWRSPQAMIPTAPPATTHYLPPPRTTPAPPATSAVSAQNIAAALAKMNKLPVVSLTLRKLRRFFPRNGV